MITDINNGGNWCGDSILCLDLEVLVILCRRKGNLLACVKGLDLSNIHGFGIKLINFGSTLGLNMAKEVAIATMRLALLISKSSSFSSCIIGRTYQFFIWGDSVTAGAGSWRWIDALSCADQEVARTGKGSQLVMALMESKICTRTEKNTV